jgi:hypothetical protein
MICNECGHTLPEHGNIDKIPLESLMPRVQQFVQMEKIWTHYCDLPDTDPNKERFAHHSSPLDGQA